MPIAVRWAVKPAAMCSCGGVEPVRLVDAKAVARAQEAAARAVPRTQSFGRARSCILLFMWGGPAHQDTWDLKPEAPAEIRGEFKPISTVVPGIDIGEHFPLLARRTDKLAIIRSMTHGDVNHTTATHYLLTGQPSPPLGDDLRHDWPSLGSVLAKLGRGRGPLPPYVTMRPKLENDVPRFVEESHGQTAGWLGQSFDPLIIDADPSRSDYRVGDFSLPAEISARRLDDRQSLLAHIDDQRRAMEQAASVGASTAATAARSSSCTRHPAAAPSTCRKSPPRSATATAATRTANRCCKPAASSSGACRSSPSSGPATASRM